MKRSPNSVASAARANATTAADDGQEDGGTAVDRAVCDVPRREQAPMLGRENLYAHGLGHVEVRVSGHRASSMSRAEPSPDPGRDRTPELSTETRS